MVSSTGVASTRINTLRSRTKPNAEDYEISQILESKSHGQVPVPRNGRFLQILTSYHFPQRRDLYQEYRQFHSERAQQACDGEQQEQMA